MNSERIRFRKYVFSLFLTSVYLFFFKEAFQ